MEEQKSQRFEKDGKTDAKEEINEYTDDKNAERPKTECKTVSLGKSEEQAAGSANAAENKGGDDLSTPTKKSKKNVFGFILSAAIIVCVMFALLQLSDALEQGDSATFQDILKGMNWWYVLAAVGLFVAIFVTDALKYVILARCYDSKLSVFKCAKVALIGKYYDGITPLSTGGQPMQIYYLYKQGIPGAQGSSIAFMKYGVQMLAVSIVCVLLLGCGGAQFAERIANEAMRTTIYVCGWIGFSFNACIPFFVAFVVFCPRVVSWVINLFLKLLHKIRIIKHADKLELKIRNWLDRFAGFSQFILKNPKKFFLLLLVCFVEPIAQYLLPYFLLVAMCGGEVMGMQGWTLLFTVAVLAAYATNAATFIPTPGNSGAIETVFMLAFTAVASSVLFWYVLIWRFFLYYSYILLGVGMNIFDLGVKIRNSRRQKREKGAV